MEAGAVVQSVGSLPFPPPHITYLPGPEWEGMEAGGLWSWWGGMVRTGLRFGAEPLSTSCCNTENHMAILTFDFGW